MYVVGNSAIVTIINNGTITGGAGGLNSAWPDNYGATGGMGEGGAAGSIRTGGSQGTSSQGGAGIIGANIAVINNGTITGGIGGTGGLNAGVQNDAVTFQSGINSLTLTTKSVINGVVSANGNDDTLTLQNTLSKIDGGQSDGANISATQYKGFEHLVVNGGRWTVSGSAIVSGETTLNGGALVVTGPAALGVQAITAQGGAIEASGDQVLDQSFVLKNNPYGASTSGLVVQGADNLVLSGVLSDVGRLTKNGSGTLTLTADNTYTGGTVFAGGVVSVDKEVRLGGGDLTFNGGTLQVTGTGWTSTSRAVSLQAGGGTFDIENAANNFAVTQGVAGAGGLTKSGSGTLTLSGANSYTGATTVSAGTLVVANDNTGGGTTTVDVGAGLQIGTGGVSGSLAGDIVNNGTLVVDRSNAFDLANVISGTGSLTKNGAGTLTLSGVNSYTGGTTVSAGTLAVRADNNLGDASGGLAINGGATLQLTDNLTTARGVTLGAGTATITIDGGKTAQFSNKLTGSGTLAVSGSGTLILSAANDYSGNTTIASGSTLQLGDGSTDGRLAGNVANAGTLTFHNKGGTTFAGEISGTGSLVQNGAGALTLSGDSQGFAGTTTVSSGSLLVSGKLGGTVTVNSGATLDGSGEIGGNTTVNGTLEGASGNGLTFKGDLKLGSGSIINASFDHPGGARIFDVTGDIALDGTVNVSSFGTGGPGLYHLFHYAGTSSGSGLTLGSLPGGVSVDKVYINQQVNDIYVVNTTGATLNYWNGTQSRPQGDGLLHGGNGTWTAATGNFNWTNSPSYDLNGAWDNGAFAVFGGGKGLVTVDTSAGAISASGMQFITTGYKLSGDKLTLVPTTSNPSAKPLIRVGSGSPGDSALIAIISTELTGTHGLEKADGGTLILTGANTYTGGTAISGGTLQLGDGATNGSVQGAISTGADAAHKGVLAIRAAAGTPATIGNTISGTGSVSVLGGTVTFSVANSYTGGTTLAGGTTIVTADANLGAVGTNVALNNGATLRFGANLDATHSFTHAFQLGTVASDVGTLDTDGHDVAMSGVISGAGGLMKSGTGTVTLSGANSYTGGTKVSAGTLVVANDNTGGGTMTVDVGALLQIGTGGTSGSLAGDIANDGTLVVDRSDAIGLSGAISGAGGLTKNGAGTLTLSGANSYTGATTVSAGILTLTGDNTGGGTTTVDARAELHIGTGGASGSLAGNIVNDGALVVDRSGVIGLSGVISGTGGLMKSGTGTVTLSGVNTYTGGTTLTAGTLAAASDNNLGGASGGLTFNGGTLQVMGTSWTSTNRAVSLQAGGGTFDIEDAANNFAVTQGVAGAGGLMKSGTGTVTLSGVNTYTGGTTLTAGTLAAASDNNLGGASGGLTFNGGTLQVMGTSWTSTNRAVSLQAGGGTFDIEDAANNFAVTQGVAGAGGLTKSGSGTLTLSGANSYTGATTVSASTLVVANDNTGGGTTTVDVGAGLQIGTGGVSGSLAGDIVNNGTLVVDRSNAFDLANVISGTGSLTKNGAGTLTLSGVNSYTGGTTVSAGILTLTGDNTGGGTTTVDAGAVLQIGTGGTSGNLAGDIANNGALVVNRSDALNLANAISGAGSLMKSGAGTLTLSGANSYTGATTVSAGTLTQGAAGGFSTASSRYDVDTDGTLDLGGFDTMLAALYNAGTINMNVGAAGSTLMVNGDYVGHDGTIVFNTVLGDDNSKTDKLMVGGDTAGNTNVQVVNRDGLGAQTVKGIEIITVGGQSNGVFSLVSDYRTKDGQKAVVGGAYAYTLHQGPARGANDGDWYLISQLEDIKPDNPATRRVSDTPDAPDTPAPRYSANVPVYEGYVQTMQALNKPSTLQERVGKRYMTGENGDGRTSGGMVDAHGIWARIQGAHDRLEPTTLTGMKQEINTFILQAGVDGQFYEDENGKLIAGITGQYDTVLHAAILWRGMVMAVSPPMPGASALQPPGLVMTGSMSTPRVR
ncbi:autotransporter-associated beta strand [Brucella abortus CNGB 752]|uniref:autotransporter-associated beta strand repeat-containing protein n=1 Tax=Brucella abortus TaxID=235 RepID=UPI0002CFB3D7|nr:autotransporter-associated beta strand repeat-containing protein [Brucella abortus]ENP80609.1 autotransporter-associated beta strand [Brucella abortus CNGB 752]